ncbi:hypothetical protein [Billgrantia saliphila]|uniref:hypothetical protein n=1 Tax=Billgrantia saliphila TaxID=1848458 RepID=UPI000CE4BC10|nr:hypothetical protein [Halomonas saliphila]
MADIASRLRSIKDGVTQLARLAAPDQNDAARQLAETLGRELDRVIDDATDNTFTSPDDATPPLPSAPRHTTLRCPVCSLRSFTYRPGTVREAHDSATGFEALYHCLSCGHEAWIEVE